MDRYIVIGNPVEHSLSPEIHRAFAEQTHEVLEYATLFARQDAFVSRRPPARHPLHGLRSQSGC